MSGAFHSWFAGQGALDGQVSTDALRSTTNLRGRLRLLSLDPPNFNSKTEDLRNSSSARGAPNDRFDPEK